MQETHTLDNPKKSLHVTDHLANERTFLAWIRTAIAVMTLGVAINRFALFLMEMHQVVPEVRDLANRHVEKLGIGLVILGIVMLVVIGAVSLATLTARHRAGSRSAAGRDRLLGVSRHGRHRFCDVGAGPVEPDRALARQAA